MDAKLVVVLLLVGISCTSGGPARSIYKVGMYYYRGQPAVFPISGGQSVLYYYYYGYGSPFTSFNGASVRCTTFTRLLNGRTIVGWGEKCILPGRNGIFKFQAGSPPYLHGQRYMEVRVTNGRGRVAFG